LLKARAFAAAAALPALADDSGLEVDALDGFPGVRSARWAPGDDADRVRALLERMQRVSPEDRGARFRSVVALAWPGPEGRSVTAPGTVEGRIAIQACGGSGFGYDPIFLVEDGGHDGTRTMVELSADEKNRLSHRSRALKALLARLGLD
jgi:XTP/dITP diphosphohydrolase